MSETGRKALVVINAQSRSGTDADAYIEALAAGGLDMVFRECDGRGGMSELIRSARHDVDCVVLGGGDGTMNSAAVALRETGLPLGILPLGTGNDLARTLGLPTDPAAAAAVILAGNTRVIDIGSVNGQLFFNVASIGLTVEITERLSHATKRRLGRLAYAWTAVRVAVGQRRFSALIRVGNTVHRVRTLQITVGNGRFYGGGLSIGADARIDDHMLDVLSLEPSSRWSLLRMAPVFAAGEPGADADVRTVRAPVVEVVTREALSVSADGEIVTVTPARFSVLADAITVYTP